MSAKNDVSSILKTIYRHLEYQSVEKEAKHYLKDYKGSSSYINDAKAYWAKYGAKISGNWHKVYYQFTGIEDVRYVDDSIYLSRIIHALNRNIFVPAYADKNMMDKILGSVKQPKILVKNCTGLLYDSDGVMISPQKAKDILYSVDKVIIKPSVDSGSGKGIVVTSKSDKNFDVKIQEALNGKDFVVQEYMQQHGALAEMNQSTVNTIRVSSLLWKGEVRICSTYIRIGTPNIQYVKGHADVSRCAINDDGTLKPKGVDTVYNWITELPNGKKIGDLKIPNYDKVLSTIKEAHKQLPYFKLIGWDFTIDSNGDPVLLEINNGYPGISSQQILSGPFFGDITEEVLEYTLSSGLYKENHNIIL